MKVRTARLIEELFDVMSPGYTGFMGLKAGDRVIYKQYAGRGLRGPEYKQATGRVQQGLVFADHVVVSSSNPFGQVVNSENFVRKG